MNHLPSLGIRAFSTALVFVLGAAAAAQDGAESTNLKGFMRIKLNYSKNVLEGLTEADFEGIAKNAQLLAAISQDASWRVLQTTEYNEQSKAFRSNAMMLRDAARQKDLDTASVAFMALTSKCVQCHKYVRGDRVRRAPPQ